MWSASVTGLWARPPPSFLARWEIPVVVLDGRPVRDLVGSKAICQQRDVLDVWEAVGVGRQLTDEGVTWSTARTYYKDQEISGSP